MFRATHPILGTRDIVRAMAFYTDKLGFALAFRDRTDSPNYVGLRRARGVAIESPVADKPWGTRES